MAEEKKPDAAPPKPPPGPPAPPPPKNPGFVTATIDGQEVVVKPGMTVIEAAKSVGIEIPYYCYHKRLSVAANCRMCLVEMSNAPGGKLMPACQMTVSEGVAVKTDTAKVKDQQRAVLEFLLLNHPVDCPICDQAGECKLQDYYMGFDRQPSRLDIPKVTKGKRVQLGPTVTLDQERCILCTRCVRFMREIAENPQLGVAQRGNESFITTFPGVPLDDPYAGNVVDICPVGALTSTDFRFRGRVWFMSAAASVCTGCARGCNTFLDYLNDVTYRYRPRENDAVNQEWMCDQGRTSYKYLNADRVLVAREGRGAQARTLAGSDGYGSCSTISCHFNNTAQWGTTLTCVNCHDLAALLANGAHGKHVSQAPVFYNFTGNHTTVGSYDFGCSNCHPLDTLNHVNGTVDVTLNRTNTGGGGLVGTLRSRNSATTDGLAATNGPSGIYGTTKVSIRCSAAYCHSNGYAADLRYMVSPDWYGPAYTGDKCAMCHGNSPNAGDPVNQPGSPAHYSKNFLGFSNVSGGHVVGIHTSNIFNGRSGLTTVGNTNTSSHGNAGTSSTISCNMCHYATVTSYANDSNKACVKCHGSLPKNPAELIADKRLHVSGSVDVAFMPIKVKSKAQLRDASYDKTIWSRPAGFKTAGAYDVAFKTFTTATQWDGVTKTCSNISCHNGKTVKWSETGGQTTCLSCHDKL